MNPTPNRKANRKARRARAAKLRKTPTPGLKKLMARHNAAFAFLRQLKDQPEINAEQIETFLESQRGS